MKLFIIFKDFTAKLFYYNLWIKNPIVTTTIPETINDKNATKVENTNSYELDSIIVVDPTLVRYTALQCKELAYLIPLDADLIFAKSTHVISLAIVPNPYQIHATKCIK